MSCSENTNATPGDPLDALEDRVAAAAFRRLVRHLRHRHDAQNIDLMGLSGFCRNCLADWIVDAGAPHDKAGARAVIFVSLTTLLMGLCSSLFARRRGLESRV